MSQRLIRVAFRALGGEAWSAGHTYQHYFLQAMRQYAPEVEVYVVTRSEPPGPTNAREPRVIRYPSPKESGLWGWAGYLPNRILRWLVGYDFLLDKTLAAHSVARVDVVFPDSCTVGRRTASLAWIPDFQHLHLPQMFPPRQLIDRNRGYRRAIRQATLVVVSSRDTERDLASFAPQHKDKARVLNFVASVPPELFDTDPLDVVKLYNLPTEFIYLPNQFWKHKNHLVVLEALRLLRTRGTKPFVACTGNIFDHRNPTYLADLLQDISLWGLRDQVAILGRIPHEHVLLLTRQAKCVLNPSLFEGWSTTVEEAKSVGKSVLLSNIGVHHEQDPPGGIFFDPRDIADLAGKLEETWTNLPSGPDSELERRAREALPRRMRDYAETFVSIASEAMAMAGSRWHGPH